jgi:hypothetical protein
MNDNYDPYKELMIDGGKISIDMAKSIMSAA